MKFFKHFVDASEGSLQEIMDEFGPQGYAFYFLLIELCVKKLEKLPHEEFTSEHMHFTLNERIVREKLRIRSTNLQLFLNYCSTKDLLSWTQVGKELNFHIPKILESLDRDAKRARTDRDDSAPKIKIKNKNKSVWKKEAELCLLAVRKFTSNTLAMQWLGESRKAYVEDIGGIQFIRNLKDNDFESNRLADLIQESWNRLEGEQEGA